jgi:tetratricopeptide (TPR) repeat protein
MEQSLRYQLNNREVLTLLAQHYLGKRKGSFREVKVLERAVQWRHDDQNIIVYLAQILRAHNKPERAARWFEDVIAMSPRNTEAWVSVADVYVQLRRYDEALNACNTALELVPDYASVHLMRGKVFQNMGEHERAREDSEKARQLDPLSRQAYDQLGEILATAGEYRDAINYYEHILKMNPRDCDAAYNVGRIFFSAGEYHRAVESLTRASQIDTKRLDIKILLGQALLASGEIRKAIDALESAKVSLGMSPDKLQDCLFYLGLAHLKAEDFGRAESEFESILQIEPQHIPALINLGITYARDGQMSKGEGLFRQALNIDPYSPIANTNLAICLVKAGRDLCAISHCMSRSYQIGDSHGALLIASWLQFRLGFWMEMDQCAEQLYRITYSPSGGNSSARSAFLAGMGGYLCGRSGYAVERFSECRDALWGIRELSSEMRTVDTWSSAFLALANYDISTDYDSAYEPLRICIDTDSTICDFVMQKLCASLTQLDDKGEVKGDLGMLARGTNFGKTLLQEEIEFDAPSIGIVREFLMEEEVSRYRDWLAVGPPMEGGMATVTRVYNSKLKIFGARKKLKPALVTQSLSRNGFRQEAHLCANLRHANIVEVFPDSIDDREFSFCHGMDG